MAKVTPCRSLIIIATSWGKAWYAKIGRTKKMDFFTITKSVNYFWADMKDALMRLKNRSVFM
jgi:hypothetical protein